jgi:hypothetical protein
MGSMRKTGLAVLAVGVIGASSGLALAQRDDTQTTAADCPTSEEPIRPYLEAHESDIEKAVEECPAAQDAVHIIPDTEPLPTPPSENR